MTYKKNMMSAGRAFMLSLIFVFVWLRPEIAIGSVWTKPCASVYSTISQWPTRNHWMYEEFEQPNLLKEGFAKSSYKTLLSGNKKQRHSDSEREDSILGRIRGGESTSWAIVAGLTILTVLPALLLAMTPLVRLLVVFHFLRQALGTQTSPSNQILMGLALMMTWFLIQPVLISIDHDALTPYRDGLITGQSAVNLGIVPVRHYMLHYIRQKDLELFASIGMSYRPETPDSIPLCVIIPAYMVSELKAGFQIGALLFLPFLLIDLVVASITTSIGMMQLPPVVISTPLKIILFVMVDGWNLLVGELVKGFR